jgi:hypothetical protein
LLVNPFCDPTMTKRLLTLILAATQFASWGASPLYLCFGRGGSVCIDQGSENCKCCHELDECPALDHAACDRSPAHEHEDEVCGDHHDNPAFADACDCTHYLIVQRQGPVVARGQEGAGNPSQAGKWIASDGGNSAVAWLPGLDPAHHQPGPLSMLPPGLKTPAPVVLRC